MSQEAMGVERLLAATWYLDGFWTETRLPVKRAGGGWGDVDVFGWHMVKKTLRLGSCKAYGRSHEVETWAVPPGAIDAATAQSYLRRQKVSWSKLLDLYKPPNYTTADAKAWLPPVDEIAAIELWFAGAVWVVAGKDEWTADLTGDHEDARRRLELGLTDLAADEARKMGVLKKRLAAGMDVCGKVKNYVDLITTCLTGMAGLRGWGPRTGDPLLDALREVARMAGGSARWAYVGKSASDAMHDAVRMAIEDALKK